MRLYTYHYTAAGSHFNSGKRPSQLMVMQRPVALSVAAADLCVDGLFISLKYIDELSKQQLYSSFFRNTSTVHNTCKF